MTRIWEIQRSKYARRDKRLGQIVLSWMFQPAMTSMQEARREVEWGRVEKRREMLSPGHVPAFGWLCPFHDTKGVRDNTDPEHETVPLTTGHACSLFYLRPYSSRKLFGHERQS